MSIAISPGKQQDIFNTAKQLFWKYGVKRVTIDEICKDAKVSKMTFYKFFPNKIELAKNILELVMSESISQFEEIVQGNLSFQEKIKELFALKLNASKDISAEFITDIYKNEKLGLQPVIEMHQRKSLAIFVDFLTESQSRGLIRQDIKIDFVLFYVNQMTQMMEDKQLLAKYEHPHDLIMEAMNFLFSGLRP